MESPTPAIMRYLSPSTRRVLQKIVSRQLTKHGHRIPTQADLAQFESGEPLSRTLLDWMLAVLARCFPLAKVHAFNSGFFAALQRNGWDGVCTWTRKLRRECPAGLFSRDFVLVPVHHEEERHWWLIVVCYPWAAAGCRPSVDEAVLGIHPSVAFLDPMCPFDLSTTESHQAARRAAKAFALIKGYLAQEWSASIGTDVGGYDVQSVVSMRVAVPQQPRTDDSGVYTLEFARCLFKDPRLLEALGQGGVVDLAVLAEPRTWWMRLSTKVLRESSEHSARRAAVQHASSSSCASKRSGKSAQLQGRSPGIAQTAEEPCAARSAEQLVGGSTCSTGLKRTLQLAHKSSPKRKRTAPGRSVATAGKGRSFATGTNLEAPSKKSVVLCLSKKAQEWLTVARKRSLQRLGASFSVDGSDATHVVIVGALRRTMRVMGAICLGQHIVALEWLKASLDAGQWACEPEHEPPAQLLQCPLSAALERARKRPLLAGYSVHVLPSVAQRLEVAHLVASAGGELVEGLPAASASSAARVLLVGTASDGRAVRRAPLLQPEQLFEACMVQQLDLPGWRAGARRKPMLRGA